MKQTPTLILTLALAGLLPCGAGAFFLPTLSPESKACAACHQKESQSIYDQWGGSAHYRANVGCYECHGAPETDADAFMHEGKSIAVIVSPKDCARCHEAEVNEFASSHHAKGARILGSLDNTLAEVVEGNNGFKTMGFP
ncbi:MAG TPA: multiheme c-type cytochrome, partial [Oceanipulchritudo sp.]|nr:multiheme c-type cytochrome [Oceanipulchritudo sp.]